MKQFLFNTFSISLLCLVHNAYANFPLFDRMTDDIGLSDDINPDDISYALNWLHAGYQRSMGTIHAQKATLELLDASWKSWQIITHRRRNPSKSAPHADALQKLTHLSEQTHQTLEQYEKILDDYDALSTRIFTAHCIKNKTIQTFLEAVKAETRVQITAALTDVKALIEECSSLNWIFKGVTRLGDELAEIDIDELDSTEHTEEPVNRSLLETIREKLPIIAFDTFVKADINYVKASDSHWSLLYNTQCASNAVWRAVETARARVLKYAYERLYQAAGDHEIMPLHQSTDGHTVLLPHTLDL